MQESLVGSLGPLVRMPILTNRPKLPTLGAPKFSPSLPFPSLPLPILNLKGKETTDEEEEHGGDEGELARPACKLLQADQSVRCLWEVQFCFRLRMQVMHAGHFPPAPGNLGERFPGGTSPWGTSSGKTKLVPRGNVPLGDVPPGNGE